jgi:hypothetical protein
VEIKDSWELTDGGKLERFREFMQGSPEEPMTDAEALEKFFACMVSGLGADSVTIEKLARTITALETLDDVSDVVRLFPQAI